MGFIRKKPDWTWQAFKEHWLGPHARLAEQLRALRGYVQNHIVDRRQRSQVPRGPEEFDGFSQLWFDDDAAMRAAIATDLGPKLVADESHFIGHLRIVTIAPHEIVPLPATRPPIKQLSLLRRRDGVAPERFRDEWRSGRAPLVAAIPGIRAFRQCLAVARQVPKGTPVGYDGFPIDGIEEMWFESVDALEAGLASKTAQEADACGKRFIAEATTYLVREHLIA
jgi:uncharacterized protein (TIGR02118 family)